MNEIERFGRRIGEKFHAEKVILFGSCAEGAATVDSDVDLLIICKCEAASVDKSVEIRMELRPKFPVDLLVRTPEKIRQRLEMGDSFIKQILEEGKVIYETNNR